MSGTPVGGIATSKISESEVLVDWKAHDPIFGASNIEGGRVADRALFVFGQERTDIDIESRQNDHHSVDWELPVFDKPPKKRWCWDSSFYGELAPR